MRLAGYVARMEEMKNAYKTFIGKSQGKGARGRPRCTWEVNMRMISMETVGRCGLESSVSG
jgi:hypothetical protein